VLRARPPCTGKHLSIRNLHHLLEPRSVAVFGASTRAGRVGSTVWRNLRAGSFKGPLYAVNPKHTTLDGERVYARAADLPAAPDLAVLCTPPESVPGLIAELGAIGTRAAIVMTAGLTAPQKAAALAAARPHLLRLLGPNCIGLMTPRLGLNATFAHIDAIPGNIAFVSQSGALVTAMLDWARTRGIGFSQLVSLGEHIDVDFGDLLDVLASDAHTRAVLLYIESINAPRKFMSAARAAARNKPVIVVKAGRAGGGMRAAASHTGAMAGSDIVFDAAICRAGMLRVDTLNDLFLATQTLARFRGNTSDVLTIMTNGGGGGVMAADAAGLAGVPLHALDEAMLRTLDATLPATWSHANPIDLIGDAPAQRYTDTLKALLARPQTGAVLFLHAPTAIVRSSDIALACAPLLRATPGRVMGCWLGDAAVAEARAIFTDAGVPDYATPEDAVRGFALLRTYRRNQLTLLEAPASRGENAAPDLAAAGRVIEGVLASGRELLSEVEAKALLSAYRVPVVHTVAAAPDADAVVAAAREAGYPVVLKILSRDITHKSDVGGVALGLRDEAALRAAVQTMLARVREARPGAHIDGFAVQPMAQRPHAHELIVGASIDAVFGPIVLFGQGGIAVEQWADHAIALPPLNRTLAAELVGRTRVSRLLAGFRDRPPAHAAAIHSTLIAVAQMLADWPQLAELDINPLWADEQGVLALDARVHLSREAPAGTARFAIRPYPAELAEELTWRGRQIVVRPIRPEDEAQHLAFLERLDPEDVRMRVFYARTELPRSELARLTQIDYEREMAFIATERDADGTQHTLGVVRAISDPDNIDAEFAIIVRSDLKGQGLGRLLMGRVIDYARSRGTRRLVGDVLSENTAMLKLARLSGFTVDPSGSDGGVVHIVRPLQGE
jgi:acetyltransferase